VDFKHIFPSINLYIFLPIVCFSFRRLWLSGDVQYNHKGYDFLKSLPKSIHNFWWLLNDCRRNAYCFSFYCQGKWLWWEEKKELYSCKTSLL